MKDNKERSRIIFIDDIESAPNDEQDMALELSKQYPNLVIFSDAHKLSEDGMMEKIDDDVNLYHDEDYMVGACIYKNGIRYTVVRGVHPKFKSVNIGSNAISLKIDKYGLLRLYRDPILEGYFHVSTIDPRCDKNEDGRGWLTPVIDTNEYVVNVDSFGQPMLKKYNTVTEIFSEENIQENGGSVGFYRDYALTDIESAGPAYLLMPREYRSKILVSNTTNIFDITNTRYVWEILDDKNFAARTSDIYIDGIEYMVIRTIPDCWMLRIFYKT